MANVECECGCECGCEGGSEWMSVLLWLVAGCFPPTRLHIRTLHSRKHPTTRPVDPQASVISNPPSLPHFLSPSKICPVIHLTIPAQHQHRSSIADLVVPDNTISFPFLHPPSTPYPPLPTNQLTISHDKPRPPSLLPRLRHLQALDCQLPFPSSPLRSEQASRFQISTGGDPV